MIPRAERGKFAPKDLEISLGVGCLGERHSRRDIMLQLSGNVCRDRMEGQIVICSHSRLWSPHSILGTQLGENWILGHSMEKYFRTN